MTELTVLVGDKVLYGMYVQVGELTYCTFATARGEFGEVEVVVVEILAYRAVAVSSHPSR